MSAHLKRGIIVWMLAFLTFLAAINTLYVIIYGVDKPLSAPFKPYLVGQVIGEIPRVYYFWISVAAAGAFLALTSILAFRRLPDPHLFWKIDKLENGIKDNSETIRAMQTDLLVGLENNRKAREEFMKKVNTTLANTKKEMTSTLERQGETVKEMGKMVQRDTRETLSRLKEHGKLIQQMESTARDSQSLMEEMLERQRAQVSGVMERVENLEQNLLPPPRLTSQDRPEEIKRIGPQLGEELRDLGITTVAELIAADPRMLAENTRASRDMVKHLQTIAQLLMIPSIKEDHAELLEEAGITTRKELSIQEPLQLSRDLETIDQTYIKEGRLSESEKPTMEDILSWIKQAKI